MCNVLLNKNLLLILATSMLLFSTAVVEADWPMAGANPERTSWVTEQVSGDLDIEWYVPIEPYISQKVQVVATGGRVYVSTSRGLYAFNASTGATEWIFPTEVPLGHSPTVDNGVVYVGGLDRNLYAIDASMGSLLWYFTAEAGFQNNPVVVNNVVYIGSRDGKLYAIHADGTPNEGTEVWASPFQAGGALMFSPAYADGTLYIAANDGHAYAVDASTGAQVWKSPKLPTGAFQSWWPVVADDKLLLYGGENYSNANNMGLSNQWLQQQFRVEIFNDPDPPDTSLDDEVPGVVVTPTPAWANGNTVYDFSLPNTAAGALAVTSEYFESKPYRRTFFVLNRSNGNEVTYDFDGDSNPEYAPILHADTHGGSPHPPLVAPDGIVYVFCGFKHNGGYIPRGSILGWKPDTPYMMSLGFDRAIDEPVAAAGGGDLIYYTLCCMRTGDSVSTTGTGGGTYWGYGLYDELPNLWTYYRLMGTDVTHACTTYGTWNGVYGLHADNNPPVPYNGKVYVHRLNHLLCLSSTGGRTARSEVTIQTPPATPQSLTVGDLLASLEAEIDKMIAAGHLRPGYCAMGFMDMTSIVAGDDMTDYFHEPGETIRVLCRALPHLPGAKQTALQNYIQSEFNSFPPYTYTHIGWNSGAKREAFDTPPEVQSVFDGIGPKTQWEWWLPRLACWHKPPQANYAMYKYAEIFGNASTMLANQVDMFTDMPDDTFFGMYPSVLNAYIAGFYGLEGLYELDSQTPPSSITNELNRLLSLRVSTWSKDRPDVEDLGGGGMGKLYQEGWGICWNFMYLVPELGQYLHDNLLSPVQNAMNEYDSLAPYWFVARMEEGYGEDGLALLQHYHSLFQAKALILQEPFNELVKYVDIPAFAVGDLYYINNLVSAIEADTSGNLAPVVDAGSNQSITLPDDDVSLDGTVSDDGQPDPPGAVTVTWSKDSGPGTVTFANDTAVDTSATFSTDGVYVLRLTADDSDMQSYDTVTITVNSTTDTTPPTPDPLTWATAPHSTGTTSISMTATAASDPSGVEYLFDCTAGGGHDSGWQDSTTYQDTGLSASTQYTYRVQARDKSANQNAGGWSTALSATTDASGSLVVSDLWVASGSTTEVVDSGLAVGAEVCTDRIWTFEAVPSQLVGQTYIKTANGDKRRTDNPYMTFSINVDCTVYVAHDDRLTTKPSWLSSFTLTADDLVAETAGVARSLYSKSFSAGTVSLGANEGISNSSMYTVVIVPEGAPQDTDPPTPDPLTWATVPYSTGTTSISMTATTASDPSGVEYFFECTAGGGNDSGWQDSTTYEDTGLSPSTQYTYRVQARDKSTNQNTGGWSTSLSATTDAGPDTTPPTPDPLTWASVPAATGSSSIAMTATTASDPSGVEYYFECTAGGGNDSGWQAGASYTDTGLTPDTQYTYRVRARDLSVNQNATAWSTSESATTDPAGAAVPVFDSGTFYAPWYGTTGTGNIPYSLATTPDGQSTPAAWAQRDNAGWTEIRASGSANIGDRTFLEFDCYWDTDTKPGTTIAGFHMQVNGDDGWTFKWEDSSVCWIDGNQQTFNPNPTFSGKTWQHFKLDLTTNVQGGTWPSSSDIGVIRIYQADAGGSSLYLNNVEFTGGTTPPDTDPPTPDPLVWATVPYPTGTTSISMTATTASDPSGVEYYFECTAGGGNDSGWQDSTTYEDTGLSPSTQYTYRVQARDKSTNQNATGWSTSLSATTDPTGGPGLVQIIGTWTSGTTHADPAGSDRAVIFVAHAESSADTSDLGSVTYGGQSMTKAVFYNMHSNSSAYTCAFILDEAGIAAATSDDFIVTWNTSPSGTPAYTSVFLSGVNQSSMVGETGTGGTTTTTAETAALSNSDGDMAIVAGTCGNAAEYSVINGFTEAIEVAPSSADGIGGYLACTGTNVTPGVSHTNVNRQSVIGMIVKAAPSGPDTDPPTPDPMTWASVPAAAGPSSVTMTATTASDASGVEYFFECTAGGGNDSGWQDSTNYTDTGLSELTQYTYRVQARDKSTNQNATAWSTSESTTTEDGTAPTPDPATWATVPYSTGTTSISMTATTASDPSGVEYFFECTAGGGNDSGWQAGTTYEDTGLSPNTQYTYRARARDLSTNQNATAWSTSESAATDSPPDSTPPTPDPATWATVPYSTGTTSISMTATTAFDPSGVEYFFDCTAGGGNDSGWQDSTTYEDTGLSPSTQYTYRVQARDKSPAQNATGWSTSESATTDALPDTDPPTPDPATWATLPFATGTTSISMTATTASDPSGVEYFFDCTAGGGNDSNWQDSATYEDTGLTPDTQYTYRVQARDKSPAQNAGGWSTSESATTDATPDTTPPTPDPLTWASVPAATGSSSISMTATTASDPSGVEYYFDCTAGGGNDSVWQDSTTYEDTGLSPDTQYTYRVQARDKSTNQNATGWSTAESATTDPDGGQSYHIVFDGSYQNGWSGIGTTQFGGETVLDASGGDWSWHQVSNTSGQDLSALVDFEYEVYFDSADAGSTIEWHMIAPTGKEWDNTYKIRAPCMLDGGPVTLPQTLTTDTWHTVSFDMSSQSWWPTDGSSIQYLKWQWPNACTAYIRNVSFVGPGGEDTDPPTPDPLTWATMPYSTGTTSISMTATTASDPSGVEYYFDCTAGGGNDSAWQDSTTYEDTGLTPDTQYTYRVQARDKSTNQNAGGWSTEESATTDTSPDVTPPTPDPMTWATVPYSTGASSISMTATTASDSSGVEYNFDCTAGGGHDSGWQDSTTYQDTGLSPSTQYTYRVQARDKSANQNATAWSTSESATTDAGADTTPPTPDPLTWSTVPYSTGTTSISMTATTASDSSGVEYYFDCTAGGGHDSGWQDSTTYQDTGLSPSTQYTYRVQARDKSANQNATTWSTSESATTDAGADTTPPTPDPMTWATTPHATGTTSISMTATTASDPSGVEYFFDCTAGGGHDSVWRSSPTYTDTGLSPGTQYTYRVRARDLSANQNATGWSSVLAATTNTTGNTVVSISNDRWYLNGVVTHQGNDAEGLLMNVRMVNSVFEDARDPSEWPSSMAGFDPDDNTTVFINKIPEYYTQGIRAFDISLQGGNPGYEGAWCSAYNSNGSLRTSYMDRVKRVIDACNDQGIVVILNCFYQRQHGNSPTYLPYALSGQSAIETAVQNVANWIESNNFQNVVVEIANEYTHSGYNNWADGSWLRTASAQVQLMNIARTANPSLLVSTSGTGGGYVDPTVANGADYILIHLNNTSVGDYASRIATARSYGKPVLCNEDDKLGGTGASALQASVDNFCGWGFMHSAKNQYAPFEFDGRADDPTVYDRYELLTGGGAPPPPPPDEISVIITQPSDGSTFAPGADITITAAPTPSEGETITKVEFFAGAEKIGERTSSPWEIVWQENTVGMYVLMARATDSGMNTDDSPTIDIYISDQPDLVVSNLWVASGSTTEVVDSGLAVGALVCTDRTWTFEAVPSYLVGQTYIKTANVDKQRTDNPYMTFSLNVDCTVYVAHDDRLTTKPSWLSSFTLTADDLVAESSGRARSLYSKSFSAGTVSLGANEGISNSSMYTVVIVPEP